MARSKKDRRSERIAAKHRMILSILGTSGAELLKEIITTVEVSQHGARIQGRRTLQPGWQGALVHLSSGRQAPIRVVWHVKAAGEYFETGIELLAEHNFWGRTFANPDVTEQQPAIENLFVSPQELIAILGKSLPAGSAKDQTMLEAVWCGLVEQLEERKVFTRQELVAAIRKLLPG